MLSRLVAESTPWEPIPRPRRNNRHFSGPRDVFGFPIGASTASSGRHTSQSTHVNRVADYLFTALDYYELGGLNNTPMEEVANDTDPGCTVDDDSAQAATIEEGPVESDGHNVANDVPTTISGNYRDTTSDARNQSENISHSRNTSLWITGLPGDINYHRLLSSIRNIGRVYKIHIVQAEGEHVTAAATIQFFELRAAEALMQRIRDGNFVVEGHVPQATRNRTRSSQRGSDEAELSRVIVMRGHSRTVNRHRILSRWARRFYWHEDEVLEFRDGQETVLEIRFACYSRQAENAARILATNARLRDVDYWFGEDPCAAP